MMNEVNSQLVKLDFWRLIKETVYLGVAPTLFLDLRDVYDEQEATQNPAFPIRSADGMSYVMSADKFGFINYPNRKSQ